MAGLVPAIHVFVARTKKDVDARLLPDRVLDKSGKGLRNDGLNCRVPRDWIEGFSQVGQSNLHVGHLNQ
jgi:hypothetical protein